MAKRRAVWVLVACTAAVAACVGGAVYTASRARAHDALDRRFVARLLAEDWAGARAALAAGADPNARDCPQTPHMVWDYLRSVVLGRNRGVCHGQTALMMAQRNAGLVRALLAAGARVSDRADLSRAGFVGETALHMAAGRAAADEWQVVQLLLDHGADPNARDAEGCTPLHFAAFVHNTRSVRVLLAHGADPRAKDRYGATALQWASAYPPPPKELVDVLKKAGTTK